LLARTLRLGGLSLLQKLSIYKPYNQKTLLSDKGTLRETFSGRDPPVEVMANKASYDEEEEGCLLV